MDLSSLVHLSAEDRRLFEQYGVGEKREVPFGCLHHAFEHHAGSQPDAVAVEDNLQATITYAALDVAANRLANLLRSRGIRPGKRVCLLVRRSIPMMVAILAILKAGGQYVPLDAVTITDSQLQFVLEDSGASMVLSMADYIHRISYSIPSLCLEDILREQEEEEADASKPEDLATTEDGIYVIYTSGTTGQPKGVDVRHSGVVNVVCQSPGNVSMRPGYRVAQLLNIAFDMCAWEVLSSMANGCTLCLRGNTSAEWRALMKTVDVVISTPSVLMRHDPRDYPNIRHVITGGEPCPQALADRWAEVTQFNNCCGPTEISVANTVQPHTPGYPLSIGRPIPNTNVYILDSDARAVPIGEPGLMWVGGVGVSRGYLNLPEKVAERWRNDPFFPNGRMFNTGDLGRWRPDGQLDHLGRADDQIKVKGFRVEPDGVAFAMRSAEGVASSVVLLIDSDLWGFVTPAHVDLEGVRKATAAMLPYYAVPSRYMRMAEFPQTRNGKVDKRALREMAENSSAPSTPGTKPLSATMANGKRWLVMPNRGVPFDLSLPGTPSLPSTSTSTDSCSPSSFSPSPESSTSPSSNFDSSSVSGSETSEASTPPPATPVEHTSDDDESIVPNKKGWTFESHLLKFRQSLASAKVLRMGAQSPSSVEAEEGEDGIRVFIS